MSEKTKNKAFTVCLSVVALVALSYMMSLACDSREPTPVKIVKAEPKPEPVNVLPPELLRQESIAPPPSVSFVGPYLSEVGEGKTVWVYPWTMWVVNPGSGANIYVMNATHPYFDKPPKENYCIRVTRKGGGWIVDLSGTTYEWAAMDMKDFKSGDVASLPVLEIRK
jgi:hypothetical protein